MARPVNNRMQNRYPKKLYYFICEDMVSMYNYLQGIKRKYGSGNISIQVESSRSETCAKSVHRIAKSKRDALRREGLCTSGYKVIACFDKDQNNISDIENILSSCTPKSNMATIYNNPCYEYWLILHMEDVNPEYTYPKQCVKECMDKINHHYNKSFTDLEDFKSCKNVFDILGNDLENAIKNAKSLSLTDIAVHTPTLILFLKRWLRNLSRFYRPSAFKSCNRLWPFSAVSIVTSRL